MADTAILSARLPELPEVAIQLVLSIAYLQL
jgi:hypothetical protein